MTSTISTTTTCPVTPVNLKLDVRDEVGHSLDIPEITEKVFEQCLFNEDLRSIQTLACLSARICNNIQSFQERKILMDTTDLQKRFPALRILDTNILPQLQVYEQFRINLYALLKGLKELSPHIEGNAGLSLLIMRKGTTLNKMVDYAKSGQTEEEKMRIDFYPNEILTELGDVAVEETCVVLITNNVFNNSRVKIHSLHCDFVPADHQCELPTALGYLGLIVLTQKLYHQCLYGQDPMTYGRSSTSFKGNQLVVGGSASGRVNVDDYRYPHICTKGSAGQRKL